MEDSSRGGPVPTLRQKQLFVSDSSGGSLDTEDHNGDNDVASCRVSERTSRRSGSRSEEEGESELSSCEDSDYKESVDSAASDGEGNEHLAEVEQAVTEGKRPQKIESAGAEADEPPVKKRRKKRSNDETKGGKKKERGKKKSQKKKANMRRNIKETSLKELNPETFSAHNEELERMMRIGQLDSLSNMELQHNGSDGDGSGLPQSVLSLLNATWDTEGGGGADSDPLDSILGGPEEKALKLDGMNGPLQRPAVATWGETSQSVANGEDSAERSHEEASLQAGLKLSGMEHSVAEVGKDDGDVIVLNDSDTEGEGPAQGAPVHPSSGASNLASLRSRYLGLDVAEMGGTRDPKKITINPTHSPSEPDLCLAPQVAIAAKPHQIGGIRFLYDNIIESLKRFDKSEGYGCILAHSMGLGKTLQAIGFTDLFLRNTPSKHVMIVVPVNTLMNWISEFDRWLPEAKMGLKENGASATNHTCNETDDDATVIRPRNFKLFSLNDSAKTMAVRVSIIKEWRETGGVLLIGYEMYRLLAMSVPSIAGNKMAVKKRRTKKKEAVSMASSVIDLDKNEKEMDELIAIQEALCKPGPDLVICDEGHRIRNEATNISQSLKMIRTHRRIVMTGYPLQNNLLEYWCMVDFVRPNYLGDKKEFQALFERPIVNGQCVDSTPYDVATMKRRSHVLHRLLQGFVLRCDHSILKSTLPPKYEHVLYTRPSEVQMKLYNYAQEQAQTHNKTGAGLNPIVAFSTFTKIWNHPDIFHQFTRGSKETAQNLRDLDVPAPKDKDAPVLIVDWPEDVSDYSPLHIENGSKFVLLMDVVDLSVALGEKVLIFSQSLSSLTLIERFLSARPIPHSKLSENGTIEYSSARWKKDVNYFRLDGSSAMSDRESMIDRFNSTSNSDCWLFLLSTRAGCLGVNLVAASRVVMMDVSWNPCHDAQAVCRVYRYGQQKPCHIYRLVSDGTMEKKVYQRQISKQGMSDRIVDELNPERNLARSDIESLIEPPNPLPPPEDLSGEIGRFGFDPILMTLCYRMGNVLTKVPFEHESLLLDKVDDKLTETEKVEAWKDFHTERDRSRRGQMYVSSFNGTSTASPTPGEQQPAKLSYAEAMAAIAAKQHAMASDLRMPAPSGVPGGYPSGLSHQTQTFGPGQRQLIPPPVCGALASSLSSTASSSGSLWPQRSIQTYRPTSQPFSNYPNMHHLSTSVPNTAFGTTSSYPSSAGPGASIAIGPGATMATGPGATMATGPGASMAHRSYSAQGSTSGFMPFHHHDNSLHPQSQIPGTVMNGSAFHNAHPSSDFHVSSTPYSTPFSSIISLLDSDDSDNSPSHALSKSSVNYGYKTSPSPQPPMGQGVSSYTGNQAPIQSDPAENGLSQSDLNKFMEMLEMIPSVAESDL